MRLVLPALALVASLCGAVDAHAAAWQLEPGDGSGALLFGTPAVDRDAFRLDCSGGMLSLSTWTPAPPRGVTDGEFPTRLSVFFGRTELAFAATGRVTGPGRTSRIDARIADPKAFLASLDEVRRLTTVTHAGRRMAPAPASAQIADFGKACGF
jgi:hypothetical protein